MNDRLSRRGFLTNSAALAGAAMMPPGARAEPAPLPDVDTPGRTPNTAFAVNIEMWFKGSMEDRIRQAAELGFPAIEFWPYQGKNIEAMAAILREHNMTATQFTGWGFGRELNRPDAAPDNFLRGIEESCAVAEQLPGCTMFTVVAGDVIDGVSHEAMLAAVAEKLKRAAPILERHNKTAIVEPMNPFNHPGHCLYGSRDGIALCEAVGSKHVKLNWDLFHMQRYEGNVIDAMRRGREHIGYLQMADAPDRNEPGTGEMNYTNIFRAIREIGYTLPVGLECNPQGGDVLRAGHRLYAADTW